MVQSEKINIVNSFIKEIKSIANAKHCLKLAISDYSIFDISGSDIQTVTRSEWIEEIPDNTEFDLVLGDFPLGTGRVNYQFGNFHLNLPKNWADILLIRAGNS